MRLFRLCMTMALIVAGCTTYAERNLKTVSAGGKVMLADGRPLRAGLIKFIPEDVSQGREMAATLDKDGSFKLDYRNGEAVPGRYTVVLDPKIVLPGEKPDASAHVPAKYQDQATSPLKVAIKYDSPNEFRFKLE